jgi:hypothetical protein
MSWYKKYSQQLELGLESPESPELPKKRLKTDPDSIDQVIGVVAAMIFNDKTSNEVIGKILKDLKGLKDGGVIKFPIGQAVYNKFDKACRYINIPAEDVMYRKKMAFDRLRKVMEEIA